MAFQVSPGVNVSEIDLTTVVPAVSTTTGALAGHFKWGPVDQRILVSSEDQLVNVFNKPNANTADDFFTAANFLAYGNALYITRAVTSANNATTGGTGAFIKNEDYYNETYSHSSGHGDWVAKYPGDIGNSLEVSVCHNANAWESTVSTNYYATRESTTVTLAGDGQGSSNAETQFVAGDILLLGPDKEQRKVASISGNTITLTSKYQGNTVSNYSPSLTRRWEYFNNFDRAPSTTTYANTVNAQGDAIHIAIVDEDGTITGQSGTVLEKYENVSQAPDAKGPQGDTLYYKDVINNRSQWVWWGAHNSNMGKAGTRADLTNTGSAGSGTNFPGNDLPVTNSMTKGKDGSASDAAYISAYNYFRDADTVDVSLVLGSGSSGTVAIHIINNIAEHRKDCVAVISPERADVVNNNTYEGKERDDIIAFRDTLPSSSYAVMDSGWKYQYDKYNDVYRYVPLNGDTAGLMVQTDLTRDPWYSPAGFNRGNVKNVIKLAYNPSKTDRDELYKKGVNPVVTFPGQGTVLFGDKTMLDQPSAFDRINVRRLFIVLEKAISTAAKFTLFEFNDEFTRSQFKNLVEPFLRDVQGRRGITDFQVVVDGTNNTGEVIDRNEFVGDIYIKPARSINFIQLNFVAVRTGVEFSEVVGRAT